MGYPEQASAELGKQIEEECLKLGGDAILKAIADAEEARKTGKRIGHDNGGHFKIRSVSALRNCFTGKRSFFLFLFFAAF